MKTWTVVVWRWGLHRGRPRRWLPKGRSEFYLKRANLEFRLTALWKRYMCVVGVWVGGDRLSRPSRPDLEWEVPEMGIKKRVPSLTLVKHLAAVETNLMRDLMPLVEHCCLRQYDDGSEREPGWLTVKTSGAAWCVQVKDPDTASSFTAVADTLDRALETAALLLAADEAPWEPDQWLARQRAEKKKK